MFHAVVVESDAEVYAKSAQELVGFATAAVGPSDAEDVVAGAVLRAMSSGRWPDVEHRRAYLYRAVLSEALNLKRASGRRLRREARAGAALTVEMEPADRDVLLVLGQLSVQQRAAIYLRYWVDLPVSEIARSLGMSERSAERELTTARRRIGELLT